MIFNVLWTLFFFRGASSALGIFPYESGAFISIGVGNLFGGLSRRARSRWSRASGCCCTSA